MAYFVPKEVRSLAIKTHNKGYHFKKDQPLLVEIQEDIDRFRNEVPLVETDNQGNRLATVSSNTTTSRAFKKFKATNGFDAEQVLKDVYEETVRERESKPVDVKALLEEANKESFGAPEIKKIEDNDQVEVTAIDDVIITENKEISEPEAENTEPIKKKKKKSANECPKCGRKFESKTALDIHLEDHDMEE
jgi:hypothetical protein